jgi:hypothetical protein
VYNADPAFNLNQKHRASERAVPNFVILRYDQAVYSAHKPRGHATQRTASKQPLVLQPQKPETRLRAVSVLTQWRRLLAMPGMPQAIQ